MRDDKKGQIVMYLDHMSTVYSIFGHTFTVMGYIPEKNIYRLMLDEVRGMSYTLDERGRHINQVGEIYEMSGDSSIQSPVNILNIRNIQLEQPAMVCAVYMDMPCMSFQVLGIRDGIQLPNRMVIPTKLHDVIIQPAGLTSVRISNDIGIIYLDIGENDIFPSLLSGCNLTHYYAICDALAAYNSRLLG